MTNFKLQYRETKWFAGEVPYSQYYFEHGWGILTEDLKLALSNFKPIAPKDQEKVKELIYQAEWGKNNILASYSWQPEIGKLYDSGDLEFELNDQCKNGCAVIRDIGYLRNCLGGFNKKECANIQQFWVLKEKVKEEKL